MCEINENGLSIGANIRLSLSRLSTKEKKITEWLLIKGNISKKTSIKEVAQKLNVSEALIVKVAKKIGYQGFKDLRIALVSYYSCLPFEKEEEISANDNINSILEKVFNNTINALKEAQSIADPLSMINAAKALLGARQIIILGVGGSATVANDFVHKLLRIGIHSNAYQDQNLMFMVACQLSKDDIVIAVSQSGETQELLKTVDIAKGQGTKIISITNNNSSSLAKNSDISIFSPARGGALIGNNAVARIIQLTLLDTLFITIILQNYKVSKINLAKSIEIVKPLHNKRS